MVFCLEKKNATGEAHFLFMNYTITTGGPSQKERMSGIYNAEQNREKERKSPEEMSLWICLLFSPTPSLSFFFLPCCLAKTQQLFCASIVDFILVRSFPSYPSIGNSNLSYLPLLIISVLWHFIYVRLLYIQVVFVAQWSRHWTTRVQIPPPPASWALEQGP